MHCVWTVAMGGTLGADSGAVISPAILVLLNLAHAVRFLSCNGFNFIFLLMIKKVLSIIFRT